MVRPKTATNRQARIDEGVALLLRALADLVRQGLARADAGALAALSRRMFDAQAPGLALALDRAAREEDAERRVLALGRACLVCDMWRARGWLPAALCADVEQAVGIALTYPAVEAHGDLVRDTWLVLGHTCDLDPGQQLVTTRTWLCGRDTGRSALVLRFTVGLGAGRARTARRPSPPREGLNDDSATPELDDALEPGTSFVGTLAFWPSAAPQRARVVAREGEVAPLVTRRLPGRAGIDEALAEHAGCLARQPLAWRSLVVLGDVKIGPRPGAPGVAQVVDGAQALPLVSPWCMTIVAVAGGQAVDLVAEWDGRALTPLALNGPAGYFALELSEPAPVPPPAAALGPAEPAPHPLARAALVGVAPGVVPPSGTGLDDLVTPREETEGHELTLLRRAGLLELARRAARLPDPALALPAPAPPETGRYAAPRVAAIIAFVLRPSSHAWLDVHDELFSALAERGLLLPPHLVAAVLENPVTAAHPASEVLLGERGAWLARLFPPPAAPRRRKKSAPPTPSALALDWSLTTLPSDAHARALAALPRPFPPEISAFAGAWLARFDHGSTLAAHPLGGAVKALALGASPAHLGPWLARAPHFRHKFADALVIAETRRRFFEELTRDPSEPRPAAA